MAGTPYAAQACGQSNSLGTLLPGKLADVIIVEGNPLADIHALGKVVHIMKDGQFVYTSSRLNY